MDIDKPEISEFESVDPAPPSNETDISRLRKTLIDEEKKMFQRMRALFALRGIVGEKSVEALAAAFISNSALLKHEIAYVWRWSAFIDPCAELALCMHMR